MAKRIEFNFFGYVPEDKPRVEFSSISNLEVLADAFKSAMTEHGLIGADFGVKAIKSKDAKAAVVAPEVEIVQERAEVIFAPDPSPADGMPTLPSNHRRHG